MISFLVMKQKRYGKKTYNWHRPLGKNQFKSRFLRHREDQNSVTDQLKAVEPEGTNDDLTAWPDELEAYCPQSSEWQNGADSPEAEKNERRLLQLLDTLLVPFAWQTQLDRLKSDKQLPHPEPIDWDQTDTSAIEERLSKHLEEIIGYQVDQGPLNATLLRATSDTRRLAIVKQASKQIGNKHIARLVLLFSPFWIRDPLDWDSTQGPFDLLRFLFIRHEAPGFLFPAWLSGSDLSQPHLKWLIWFILIGQGGSLKRATQHFPWVVSKRTQHHLNEVPNYYNPADAALLAEVKRLGGTDTTYSRLASLRYFRFDPTEDTYPHRKFWTDTFHWLCRNELELTDDDSYDILQWAIHEHTETIQNQTTEFSWKKRSFAACRERADEYFTSLNQFWDNRSWQAREWDQTYEFEDGSHWEFSELTTSRSLAQEGKRMRHCVATYSIRCQNGYAAIFSLKKNEKPVLTIELNPTSKEVVQARGRYNRPATTEEQAIISTWLKSVFPSGN